MKHKCQYPDWEGGITSTTHDFGADGFCRVCGEANPTDPAAVLTDIVHADEYARLDAAELAETKHQLAVAESGYIHANAELAETTRRLEAAEAYICKCGKPNGNHSDWCPVVLPGGGQ